MLQGHGRGIRAPAWNPIARHRSSSQFTDAAFVHLRGIQKIDMSRCRQITDAVFVHMRGIQSLYMGSCSQVNIINAVFVQLRVIQKLTWMAAGRRPTQTRHSSTCTGSAFYKFHSVPQPLQQLPRSFFCPRPRRCRWNSVLAWAFGHSDHHPVEFFLVCCARVEVSTK